MGIISQDFAINHCICLVENLFAYCLVARLVVSIMSPLDRLRSGSLIGFSSSDRLSLVLAHSS